MGNGEFLRQRIILIVQTAAIAGILLFLTIRAAAILLGSTAAIFVLILVLLYTSRRIQSVRTTLPAEAAPCEGMTGVRLHEEVRRLSEKGGLPFVPEIYSFPSPVPLAFTTGYGRRAVVVVSHGLLRFIPWRGVRAVLAHEIAHLRHHDLELFTLTSVLQGLSRFSAFAATMGLLFFFPLLVAAGGSAYLAGVLYLSAIPIFTVVLFFALSRTREYRADLGALELGVDAEDLAEALSLIERYMRALEVPHLNEGSRYLRTHPPTSKRVQRLRRLKPMTPLHNNGYNRLHAHSMGRTTGRDHR